MSDTIEIFISYAHEDERILIKFKSQLSGLRWQGLINEWYDRKILAGMNWVQEIDQHLNAAQLIILLVSPDFLASAYCYGVEMQRAMERHKAREAIVIPVIIRPCDWQNTPIGLFKALPTDGKPVISSRWKYPDEAFLDVVQGIRGVITNLKMSFSANLPCTSESINRNRLSNTLIRLDYKEQSKVFQKFRDDEHKIGAFLIHGAPSHGQIWLVNRLAKQLPNSTVFLPLKFSFACKAGGSTVTDLWLYLATQVGLKFTKFSLDPCAKNKIVHRIHGLWQRQNVLLILNNLQEIIETDVEYLNQFLREFWETLVGNTEELLPQSSKHYLLMFLVDHKNCVDKWTIPLAEQPDLSWKSHVPIKLAKLTPISSDELENWIGYEVDTLPRSLTAQNILTNSDGGIPESVLDYVGHFFGVGWSDLITYRV